MLIIGFHQEFQKIRDFPELLSSLKVDSMLFQVGFVRGVI